MIVKSTSYFIVIRFKYIFGSYFGCFHSIWILFLFYVQLGLHFRQIIINLVIFTNGV